MKSKIMLCAALLSLGATANADECVRNASNQVLMQELSRRLSSGGGGGGGGGEGGGRGSVAASFTCEWDSYYGVSKLRILLTNLASGQEKSEVVTVGEREDCAQYSEGLNRSRSVIRGPAMIATCSWDGYYGVARLNRFIIKPDLEIQSLAAQNAGTKEECKRQALAINGG